MIDLGERPHPDFPACAASPDGDPETDMRGLRTARRWFGANGGCSLGTGVT
jgi:hypothetical protein